MKPENPVLDEELVWQMLELVASPDCDISTEVLARSLYLIINGSGPQRREAMTKLIDEINKYLP